MIAILLVCTLIPNAYAGIVPSHSAIVGMVQSNQDPRYKVEFHPPGSMFPKDSEQESVVMTGGDGRKYDCILPLPADHESVKDQNLQQNSSDMSLTGDRRKPKTPDNLLSILMDQCFFRHEGWWTYEFCYQKKVRQLHVEKTKIVQEFELGTHDEEATAYLHKNSPDVLSQKDHRSKSAAQRYYSHLHTNGSMCDLTNEPRQTEVRFVCADTGNNMISSITEASTCKYILVFHAPALCKHASFQEERPQSLVINCVELLPADDDGGVMHIKDEDNVGDDENDLHPSELLPVDDGVVHIREEDNVGADETGLLPSADTENELL